MLDMSMPLPMQMEIEKVDSTKFDDEGGESIIDKQHDLDLILKYVWVGGRKAAEDKERLHKFGIVNILNVTCQLSNMHPEDFNYKRIEIEDMAQALIIHHFEEGACFINESIKSKSSILVHCMAGQSRSVSMIIAYLILFRKMELTDALQLIRKSRPCV